MLHRLMGASNEKTVICPLSKCKRLIDGDRVTPGEQNTKDKTVWELTRYVPWKPNTGRHVNETLSTMEKEDVKLSSSSHGPFMREDSLLTQNPSPRADDSH